MKSRSETKPQGASQKAGNDQPGEQLATDNKTLDLVEHDFLQLSLTGKGGKALLGVRFERSTSELPMITIEIPGASGSVKTGIVLYDLEA